MGYMSCMSYMVAKAQRAGEEDGGLRMGTQRRLRTPDPLAGIGSVWNLPEPLSASPSPSPRTSPLGRGRAPRCDPSRRACIPSDGRQGTLSFGERAGVRGNRAHLSATVSGGLRLGGFNAEAQTNAEKRREEELSASLCESLRFPGGREQRASGSPCPPLVETKV